MHSNDQVTAMDIDRNDSMSPVNNKSQHPVIDTDGQADTSLVNAASPNEMTIQLQQAVLKTLQNISTDTLTSFMSPTTNTFKAVLKGDKQLVIWRKGLEVFVSVFAPQKRCWLTNRRRREYSSTTARAKCMGLIMSQACLLDTTVFGISKSRLATPTPTPNGTMCGRASLTAMVVWPKCQLRLRTLIWQSGRQHSRRQSSTVSSGQLRSQTSKRLEKARQMERGLSCTCFDLGPRMWIFDFDIALGGLEGSI
jgi:hypothetical protein